MPDLSYTSSSQLDPTRAWLENSERQRLKAEAQARFAGMSNPSQQFNLAMQAPPAPADMPDPLSGPQPGVPQLRDNKAAQIAGQQMQEPPPLPAAAMPPPPAIGGQRMTGKQPALPGGPIPEPPSLDQAPPQLPAQAPGAQGVPTDSVIDYDALGQWRGALRSNAQSPGGGFQHVMSDLGAVGFTPEESRQLTGFGPLSPQVAQKVLQMAQAGPTSVRPYATGTDTPDFKQGSELQQNQMTYGERAIPGAESTMVNPPDVKTAEQQYGNTFANVMQKADAAKDIAQLRASIAATLHSTNDETLAAMNKQLAAYGVMGDAISADVVNDLRGRANLRMMAVNMHKQGMTQEQIHSAIVSSPMGQQYASQLAKDPSLLMVNNAPSGSYRIAGPPAMGGAPAEAPPAPNLGGGAAPAPAPKSKGHNIAPAGTPSDIAKIWGRIPGATRQQIKEASTDPKFAGWDNVRATLSLPAAK